MTRTTKIVTSLIFPSLEFEQFLWNGGFARIAGIDEAGRGAWAGPVAAAAVILPPDPSLTRTLNRVRDSKLMTPLERQTWAPRIREYALAWGVGFASAEEIDAMGIVPATKLAALRALESLLPNSVYQKGFKHEGHKGAQREILNPSCSFVPFVVNSSYPVNQIAPDYLLTDYLLFPELPLPQTALVKGDRRSLSVAAASVLAKTARDALMRELDVEYPGYGFARHKGYGTRLHQEAIQQTGLCEIHRKSFSIMD